MYKDENVKKEYFKNHYELNKTRYKQNMKNYWSNYAKKKLQKDDVTEDEIKQCMNEYYKEYRQTHKEQVNKNMENFWKRKLK